METNSLEDYRCCCGRLLFRGALSSSVVEIKCKKCGKLQSFSGGKGVIHTEIQSGRNVGIESKSEKFQVEES